MTPTNSLRRLVRPAAVGGVLVLAAYALLAMLADGASVAEAARQVPPATVGLALLSSTGNFFFRGLRWDLYLRRVGVQVPLVDRWTVFLAGFSMSLTPGKLGELLKPALLHDRYGTSVADVSSAVVAERFTDLVGVALLLAIGATTDPSWTPVAGLVLGILSFGLALVVSPGLAQVALGIVLRLPFGSRVAGIVEGILRSLRTLSQPAALAPALGLSVLAWTCQCISLWLVAQTLFHLTFVESVLCYVAPLLAGAAALVPGGVGVAEATMATMVSQFGDATLAQGSAVTAIVRGVTLWWAVVIGVVALARWTLLRRD